MRKVVFIVPNVSDTHYRNRIMEFIDNNVDVEVYGFKRDAEKDIRGLPYQYKVIGTVLCARYVERISIYIKQFIKLKKKYKGKDVIFYLCGLDIALFFHLVYPSADYIYEECDLAYSYMKKVKDIFKYIDKHIIRRSLLTIFTSGGFLQYHYGAQKPSNIILIENKLNPAVLKYKTVEKKTKMPLSIGYVGSPRYDTIYNFIDIYCKNFPDRKFHIYGEPITPQFKALEKYKNCIFHGRFNSPSDLPEIYSNIDVVLATYDTEFENVKYAEPNKIYEAIYFETPIVVSSGTFLADKVRKLGIGYDIDAGNNEAIIEFVENLTIDSLLLKITNAREIDKKETLNINDELFNRLRQL